MTMPDDSRIHEEPSAGTMNLLGLPVSAVRDVTQIHARMKQILSCNKRGFFYNLNIHAVNLALQYPWFKELVRQADLVFCDGDGVRWGLRILGYRHPPPKIATTRWIWELAAFAEKEKLRLFLLGGSAEVVRTAAANLSARFPALQLEFRDGYFQKEGRENDAVIDRINQSQPHILMVCFGMPQQEKWICDNREKLQVPILLKGGGVLDYVAGRLGQAPPWVLRLHLEWAFRIWEEPQRLLGRYLRDIPYFFARVLAERVKRFFI